MRPARYILKKMERSDDSEIADRMNQAVELMADRSALYKMLGVSGVANLMAWAGVLLFLADVRQAFVKVNDIDPKIVVVMLGFLFGLGLFFAYGLLRLKFPDIEEQNMELAPMGTFNYNAHSNKRWMVWLFAVIGGVVNLLMMILVAIGLSGG